MTKYDKLFDEIYALVAIHIAYPNLVNRIVKGEHPDWQDEEGAVGIEVVRAMSQHMGYVRSIWNEYHGEDIKTIPLKLRKGFLGDFTTHNGRLVEISDSKGLVDGTRHVQLSIHAAESKLSLLNKTHFSYFKSNELFIYVPFTINNSDMKLFCDAYKLLQKDFDKKFSRLYLFDNVGLYAVQTNTMEVNTKEYSNEQLSFMKLASLALRDTASWETNNRFLDNFLACEALF